MPELCRYRWGCIDVDEYPLDHVSIAQKLATKNLPFIVTKSKSGGAHVFLFFKEYVSAGIVHHKIKELASFMGLGHCEVFPKQEKLLREGNESDWEVGSFLNMPYHNGLDQTDRYAFDDKGNVLNLDGFIAEVEKKSITADELKKLSLKKENSEFADAPYCVEAYLTENGKVQKGSRDNFLFQYAVYAKKKYGETFEDEVHKFHHDYFEEALRPRDICRAPAGALQISITLRLIKRARSFAQLRNFTININLERSVWSKLNQCLQ